MSRLIDADELIKVINGNPFTTESVKSYIRISVAKMPTIEPERERGKWINMIEKGMCYCNQCGFTEETERAYASLFCPKCGADMRGNNGET